jgi:hypothetical protein
MFSIDIVSRFKEEESPPNVIAITSNIKATIPPKVI